MLGLWFVVVLYVIACWVCVVCCFTGWLRVVVLLSVVLCVYVTC